MFKYMYLLNFPSLNLSTVSKKITQNTHCDFTHIITTTIHPKVPTKTNMCALNHITHELRPTNQSKRWPNIGLSYYKARCVDDNITWPVFRKNRYKSPARQP
ncbi:hypothetical protein B5X24_HaOG208642 [Helicoverpa armigera]|nr:hypothetical protein B5X24_HaOG208642 [Helicoverpa armigera]